MGQITYAGGKTANVTPDNYRVVANDAINAELKINPNYSNANQLALFNAVKESAGINDSPFYTVNASGQATAESFSVGTWGDAIGQAQISIQQSTGIDIGVVGKNVSNGAQALFGGIWDSIKGAGDSINTNAGAIKDWFSSFSSPLTLLAVGAIAIAAVFFLREEK